MAITTSLFSSIKCGKNVVRNVHINETRGERDKVKKKMQRD